MPKRTIQYLTFWKKLFLFPCYLLLRLWYGTLRVRMDANTQAIMKSSPKSACVIYFWHHNLFLAPKLRVLRKDRFMYGLISASKDGAFLDALVKWFQVQPVRGSSTWRGGVALQELEHRTHEVCDIVITPDGPKGPRCVCKIGSLKWVWQHHFLVVLMHFDFEHAWRLSSWDQFCIPVPFSTIRVTAYDIDPTNFTFESFQELVQRFL